MIVGGAASTSRYLFECIIDYSYSDHTLSLAIRPTISVHTIDEKPYLWVWII